MTDMFSARYVTTSVLIAAALGIPTLALAQPGTEPPPPTQEDGAAPPPAETADGGEAPQEDAAAPPPAETAEAGVAVGTESLPAGKESGIEVGARIGAGIPFGKLSGGADDLGSKVPAQFPLWLDLGYRIVPAFYVGLYGQMGIPVIKDCTDCTGWDLRFGLNAHYHILPKGKVDPWIGLGVMGYEFLHLAQSVNGNDTSVTASGFEFVNLQGGADFRVGGLLRVGPFVSFSVDQTQDISVDVNGSSASLSGFDKAIHMWLVGGVKASVIP